MHRIIVVSCFNRTEFEKAWERAIQILSGSPILDTKIIKQRDGEPLDDDLNKLGGHLLLAVKPIKDCVKKLVDDGVLSQADLQVRIDGNVLRIIVVVPVHAFLEKSLDLKDGDAKPENV
jgi:hypothetical protein